ncbi:interferon phi 1 [Stigmatopora nigra]
MLDIRRAKIALIFFGLLIPTLGCDWLRKYRDLNNQCILKLQALNGPITNEEFPLHFPSKLYWRAEKSPGVCQWMFIRNSLGHILDLYQGVNSSQVGWDAKNLEQFLVLLHRQKDELNACVSTTETGCCWIRAVKRYYTRMSNATINGTEGTNTQWELIRSETKMHLFRLQLLVNSAQ